MSDRNWTPTSSCLPDKGEVVETMSESGQVQDLKRDGRLWFFPDGSMYVYYQVAYWRRKTPSVDDSLNALATMRQAARQHGIF